MVYPKLKKWTEFWFTHRDLNHNGIPEYGGEHSGWGSGWDNASGLGDKNAAYESPDLQAYLVLQMKALAQVARDLGNNAAATAWDNRAEAHLKLLMASFWNGRHFVVCQVGRDEVEAAPTSYLLVDGLRRGGRPDLACDLARRFGDLIVHAGGHYENYDSLSGQGLRCRGFAWTSAVNLLLMHEYLLTPVVQPGPGGL